MYHSLCLILILQTCVCLSVCLQYVCLNVYILSLLSVFLLECMFICMFHDWIRLDPRHDVNGFVHVMHYVNSIFHVMVSDGLAGTSSNVGTNAIIDLNIVIILQYHSYHTYRLTSITCVLETLFVSSHTDSRVNIVLMVNRRQSLAAMLMLQSFHIK